MNYFITENKDGRIRILNSPEYNYLFDTKTGYFARWGKTKEDDPTHSPFGPEIMDIEISTICNQGCAWCYKSNTGQGSYMSFDDIKIMFEKFPKTLPQIAFGIGDINANPDMWKIFEYCRQNKVVPNVTINGTGLTDENAQMLVKLCGAVAVSNYNTDTCYNAVEKLSKLGLEQVNIHMLLSDETYDRCMAALDDASPIIGGTTKSGSLVRNDRRLDKIGAIVFLWLKPKGDRNVFHQVSNKEKYVRLVNTAISKGVPFGFDSCSAPFFLDAVQGHEKYDRYERLAESCESTLFSYYINVEGIGFPCSFTEGVKGWVGVDVLKADSFMKDVWLNKETIKFREANIGSCDKNNCRHCQIYELEYGK
jgi:hypothetical protein